MTARSETFDFGCVDPARPTEEWRSACRRAGKVPMTKREIHDVVQYVVKRQFDPVAKRVCRLYLAGYWHEDVCRLACISAEELDVIRGRLARDLLEAGVHLRKQ